MPRPALLYEIDGVEKTLQEWCDHYGRNVNTIRGYLSTKKLPLKELLEAQVEYRTERNKIRPLDVGERDSEGRSPTRQSYRAMINRCSQASEKHKKYYYDLGIIVCDRWLGPNGFDNFLEDMGPRPKGKFIERKDQNGNYCPKNCWWATRNENMRNQRSNVIVEYQGVKMSLIELSEKTGIKYHRLRKRIIAAGWAVEQAVSEPARPGIAISKRV